MIYKSVLFGASILALANATPAFAQDGQSEAPQEGGRTATGDIVVTATRFETLASKTPIALTAVSGDDLRTAGVTNPTTLGDQVPNLMINRNNGLQITIRGVTSSDGTEKGDPSAAFMADGIYIARQQAQEVSFYDISRVEVLRGPQGTLYGRNTTAGAVNVITSRPDLTKFSGSVDAAYGNYNNAQVTAVLNTPITENFGLRFAVNFDHRDSFLKAGPNLNANLNPFKNIISGRVTALWKFDQGELIVRGDYSRMTGISTNILPTSNFFSNYTTPLVTPINITSGKSNDQLLTLTPPTADGLYNLANADNLRRNNATYGVMADFKYDLGFVTVNYLGSYREFKRHEGNYSYYPNGMAPNHFDAWYWQNSQELRLSTNGDGPVRAQAGVYYFKERSSVDLFIYNRVINGVRTEPGMAGYAYGFPQHYVLSSSLAGFGQVTVSPTSNLHLTGGVRYTSDHKARYGFIATCSQDMNCTAPGDVLTPNRADRRYNQVTWKVGADYDIGGTTMVYGTVSTGYKAGGFNDGCEAGTYPGCTLPASTLYYEPEKLTAYEIGVKTRLFDNMLRLNTSLFHYDYTNLQLSQSGPFCQGGTQCNQTTNAASAKIDGIETEGTLVPTMNDKIDFSVAWLNARYGSFLPNALTYPTLNLQGRKLDRSPSIVLMGGITHTFPLANGGEILAGVRTRYSSSYRIIALSILGQFNQRSYTQTEATLTYNSPNKNYYLQAFVRNLENNLLVTAVGAGATGTTQVSDPRIFGVRGGIKF